ncbi:MAG: ATP-dependent helicase [Burkholderiales bacterium]|nr:ATP-dependent helicase [Burkholderiales bacterium]
MTQFQELSPALVAAREADARVIGCLDKKRNFLLEAGAGAGKTYSLIETLRHLIAAEGHRLRRNNQRLACITYTNAATAVINSRIDGNPLVFTDTIHAFCWSLIKGFQPMLRRGVAEIEAWQERLAVVDGVGDRRIDYDLGHRRITDELISIHHDDVLALMVTLLPMEKFQAILSAKYPFILIDEYQDTDLSVMTAIKEHLFGRRDGPRIGLFGDHWQRIYENTCGRVTHETLEEVGKGANFRSATSIVKVLNAMRPALPQAVKDEAFVGSAIAYHTNGWVGARRTGAGGGHWKGDLPAEIAHQHLKALIAKLKAEGWDFSPGKTKILMLTHNVLAMEQGYTNLRGVFSYTDDYIKKQDDYVAFFTDKLEPACEAYQHSRYGEMFSLLGDSAPKLSSHAEKVAWAAAMNKLIGLRETGTVGAVIDHICGVKHPVLPDAILRRERDAKTWTGLEGEAPPDDVRRVRQLRNVAYREVIALDRFVDGHTPFATKHSVKGDEFENVLVVLGRGWNLYNFNQYLEWTVAPDGLGVDDRKAYERNRNLFYVSCSRSTTRLVLLFTQILSGGALATLKNWFGDDFVVGFAP